MKSINPFTEETISTYREHTLEECDSIIDDTFEAWLAWKNQQLEYRSALMKKASDVLRKNKEKYALLMTHEMGKLIGEAIAEVEKSAWVCDYYAEYAVKFLQDEIIETGAQKSFVAFEPLGIVLAVMPWNFPFWQVFRFAAPALMAGNAGILKHASNVPGCALAIEEIFREAGFPENLFRTLMIPGHQVEKIVENEKIAAVTLTGSEDAGSKTASSAGKNLKKTVLELGGSDPFVVLKDADLEKCARTAVIARMINSGQSCIAAKRFIVVKEVYDDFVGKCHELLMNYKPGNPANPETKLAPLARPDLVEDLHRQVTNSVGKGARLIMGGEKYHGKGFFYLPTLLTEVTTDMPVFYEETFGPVMSAIRAENEEHAIELANKSRFGLGGCVWTQDIEKGIRFARKIESGAMFVNGMTKSDPRLPFGGIKKSGYGRELSHYGIREFVNIKTIVVEG